MADTGQKFIRRNRMPRVHIAYDDPYNADKKIEIPFVMGVMADLSGNDPGVEKEEVADREFLEFLHRRAEDPQQAAVLAGDVVGLADRRSALEEFLKALHASAAAQADKGRDWVAEGDWVDDRPESTDDALVDEAPQSVGGCRRRHVDRARELGRRHPPVVLEKAKDRAVDRVQGPS